MTKRRLYTLAVLLLLATAPWLSSGASGTLVLGFPPWALYSLLASLAYAISMGVLLERHWDTSAAPPSDGGDG